ncbi:HNH endonuclease [Sporosarcina sp. ANT_H38]|uniref:HNH endonuclease n=1 Tax=Sporosarcina sp. ANT_H38 TaxID=2597358 RepID=UPI0011F40396|nr:HNH endonuclease [Sporosarcina sp. ANT_H38]KAA0965836.1 HNH endonuclease [Sporosarcina sp. ANT_H38]
MKYCDFNGCDSKIERGRYCSDHMRDMPKKKKKKDKVSIYHHENKSFYNSKLWKATRSYVYDRERGCCQRCKSFVFGRNAHVHHVIPIKKDITLRLEVNNLMLLCPVCHIEEENKIGTQKIFPSYFNS